MPVKIETHHRLLGNGKPTCGPFPATAAGLGFARFFFPLFQPVLRMDGHPAVRQQGFRGSRVTGGNDLPFNRTSVTPAEALRTARVPGSRKPFVS
jgi:hypothetical protein